MQDISDNTAQKYSKRQGIFKYPDIICNVHAYKNTNYAENANDYTKVERLVKTAVFTMWTKLEIVNKS